jgi:polar amino acid transport system substrate-binding protein
MRSIPTLYHRPILIMLISGLCLLTAFGNVSRAASSSGPETAENALKVGVSVNSAPFVTLQNKKLVGLDIELAKALAAYLNRPLQFVEVDWKDQIPALQEGRTDIIMSGMSVTAMREALIAFSEPYLQTGQMAMVRREDKHRYAQGYAAIFQQAPVQVFGVVKGTTGEQFVLKNLSVAKQIRTYKTATEAMSALTTALGTRRIDLLIHDGPILIHLLAGRQSIDLALVPTLLTEEYLAWGMRKDDVQLLEATNRFLKAMKTDGRLKPIVQRWVPFTK